MRLELNNIYRKVGFSAYSCFWLFQDGGQRDINAQQNELRQLNARNQTEFSSRQIQNNRLNNGCYYSRTDKISGCFDTQLPATGNYWLPISRNSPWGKLSVIDYLNVWRDYIGTAASKRYCRRFSYCSLSMK